MRVALRARAAGNRQRKTDSRRTDDGSITGKTSSVRQSASFAANASVSMSTSLRATHGRVGKMELTAQSKLQASYHCTRARLQGNPTIASLYCNKCT